ncbi:hypothetical protein SAPIO_CDS4269 [Scedosporium apiospermum]|uniref:Aminoglycoside phosphotransferase domain-containing protein n=1 Tax=Pseudallescheria apiosperma TaxID=563466 RepID=A0A084G8J9_PSEDA|nr:uncharacterized protein SAPIO_CDS4269 [Scedosporium apiospermum]KEZ43661.1 hypothetical protein SAPIO_CDS4269 [Scedosporium apiospermum]
MEYGQSIVSEMQSELATMEFVRQNTNIPIPKVYGYDLNDQNTVGCPFSFLGYVHGNTAEEVARSFPGGHEGIPEQFEEKFWRQFAEVMIQLASVRMPKIGSITRDEADPTKYVVGPLVETNSGPYESAAEFYTHYPLALGNKLRAEGEQADGQDEVLAAFRTLSASFRNNEAEGHHTETFGLANYDLNANNILVDREFNILAVIDWDSVIAVPDAALYRMPFLMGVACPIPGVVDNHPAVIRRLLLGRRFTRVVEDVGCEQNIGEDTKWPRFLFTQTGFSSKEATAFRSLTYVKMGQEEVNGRWLTALRWLRDHHDMDVIQLSFQS